MKLLFLIVCRVQKPSLDVVLGPPQKCLTDSNADLDSAGDAVLGSEVTGTPGLLIGADCRYLD